ncbi:unnamed protein product [Rotaria sp. Silwood1]|nr:unnamed protein product [Rotaria sp. Silwood1]
MQAFIKEPSKHSHAPDPDRLHIIRLKNEIKLRGTSSAEAPSTILFDVLRSTPLTAAFGLPTNDALLQTISRERPAIQLDHHVRLPLILRQTDRGESFILYEVDSMVIFTCDKNLSGLVFVPVGDVLKAYSSLVNDFDDEDYLLLDYFERV